MFDSGIVYPGNRPSRGRITQVLLPPIRCRTSQPGPACAEPPVGVLQKSLYARQPEVYAVYQENGDRNMGRVLTSCHEWGHWTTRWDLAWGDKGGSREGTITGSFDDLTMPNGIPLTTEQQFQPTLKYGGTRDPMVIHWPATIIDAGCCGPSSRWPRFTWPVSSGGSRTGSTAAPPFRSAIVPAEDR